MSTISHKKLFLTLFLLIVSINAYAKPTIAIQTWNTTRGAKVLFTEAHELPIFDINIVFYAGSAADGKNHGLADFTCSMLDAGAKTLTVNQIADNFDRIGALFYTGADRDMSTVGLRCLTEPKILSSALQTFSIVLNEPNFPEKEINRIRKQTLTAIEQKKQDPSSIAYDGFYQELYKDFPYSHPVIGTTETVSVINRKQLQDFYRQYYTTQNALIIMVGDISHKQAEEIANELTAKLPLGQKMQPVKTVLDKSNAAIKHIEFPAMQTNVFMGQLGITRSDPDYFPLYVGNYILGESPFTSDLHLEVREKLGMVYYIIAILSRYIQGPFTINFSSSNEKTENAIQVTTKLLNDFCRKDRQKNGWSLPKRV